LSFLFEYNYVPTFTLNKELAIKKKNVPIVIFKHDHLQKIISGLKNKNSNFSTMVNLLLYTGLRPSDIKDITVDDIDLSTKSFQYYSPKSEEYFIVPIHDELVKVLSNRINEVKDGRLLEYSHTRNMGNAFSRYLEELDLKDKKYNLRTFRKTFISLAYEQGIELAMVSTLVGHKKIQTTQQYYNKIGLHQKTKELKKFKLPVKKESNEYCPSYLIT
jgi:integrase/recombinase XerD